MPLYKDQHHNSTYDALLEYLLSKFSNDEDEDDDDPA